MTKHTHGKERAGRGVFPTLRTTHMNQKGTLEKVTPKENKT